VIDAKHPKSCHFQNRQFRVFALAGRILARRSGSLPLGNWATAYGDRRMEWVRRQGIRQEASAAGETHLTGHLPVFANSTAGPNQTGRANELTEKEQLWRRRFNSKSWCSQVID
jgi:hypothetical protein